MKFWKNIRLKFADTAFPSPGHKVIFSLTLLARNVVREQHEIPSGTLCWLINTLIFNYSFLNAF